MAWLVYKMCFSTDKLHDKEAFEWKEAGAEKKQSLQVALIPNPIINWLGLVAFKSAGREKSVSPCIFYLEWNSLIYESFLLLFLWYSN